MKLFWKSFFAISFLALFTVVAQTAKAEGANPFDSITYPISALGNCGSQAECKTYCDDPANQQACLDWGKSSGLVQEPSTGGAENGQAGGQGNPGQVTEGPGGCKSKEECDNFCAKSENANTCVDFGVQNGFISSEEAQKMKTQAEKKGPGGCSSKEDCDNFCKNPKNIRTCLEYSVADGTITSEEADFMAQAIEKNPPGRPGGPGPGGPGQGPRPGQVDPAKASEVIKTLGGGPGGCKTSDECEKYCADPGRAQECVDFAVRNGLMSKEEGVVVKKVSQTGGPGGCKGQAECDTYCQDQSHVQACVDFAVKNGMMTEDEAAKIKKMVSAGGPGGCKGQSECDAYCSDPAHQEECFSFAERNGMMTPEQAQMMRRQMEIGKKLDANRDKGGPGGGPGGAGPGGCKSEQECQAYCQTHQEECKKFGPQNQNMGGQGFGGPGRPNQGPGGFTNFFGGQGTNQGPGVPNGQLVPQQGPGPQGGPGGCQSEQECQAYCQDPSHQSECAKFGPQGDGMQQGGAGGLLPQQWQNPPPDFQGQPGQYPPPSGGQIQPMQPIEQIPQQPMMTPPQPPTNQTVPPPPPADSGTSGPTSSLFQFIGAAVGTLAGWIGLK